MILKTGTHIHLFFSVSRVNTHRIQIEQNTMFSKILLMSILAILFVIIIGHIEAYRFDDDQTRMDDIDDNNELNDPYLIQRLQALLATVNNARDEQMMSRDLRSSVDHRINMRFATNRRPGLLRLKKSN